MLRAWVTQVLRSKSKCHPMEPLLSPSPLLMGVIFAFQSQSAKLPQGPFVFSTPTLTPYRQQLWIDAQLVTKTEKDQVSSQQPMFRAYKCHRTKPAYRELDGLRFLRQMKFRWFKIKSLKQPGLAQKFLFAQTRGYYPADFLFLSPSKIGKVR